MVFWIRIRFIPAGFRALFTCFYFYFLVFSTRLYTLPSQLYWSEAGVRWHDCRPRKNRTYHVSAAPIQNPHCWKVKGRPRDLITWPCLRNQYTSSFQVVSDFVVPFLSYWWFLFNISRSSVSEWDDHYVVNWSRYKTCRFVGLRKKLSFCFLLRCCHRLCKWACVVVWSRPTAFNPDRHR